MRYGLFALVAVLALLASAMWISREEASRTVQIAPSERLVIKPSSKDAPTAQRHGSQDPALGRPGAASDDGPKARRAVEVDFCEALVKNDRLALKRIVDEHLKSLPATESVSSRVDELKGWIAGQPCVTSAELVPVLLDTEPSVQQVRVVLAGEGHPPPHRFIDIVLDPSGPRFNYR